MRLLPYKHPTLGWFFDWGIIHLIDSAVYIGNRWFAIKWNSKQPLRLKPKRLQRTWSDGETEPAMYIWLKFNISFAGGWGIGLTYK